MPRCGCADTNCNCALVTGNGIEATGGGSAANPYEVSVGGSSTQLVGLATSYMSINVTGTGIGADPYVISGLVGLGNPAPQMKVDAFTVPLEGTYVAGDDLTNAGSYVGNEYVWIRPTGRSLFEITVVGAGAGGSSGNPSIGQGGLGGPGGSATKLIYVLDVGITYAKITVGAGGTGGRSDAVAAPTEGSIAGGSGSASCIKFYNATDVEQWRLTAPGGVAGVTGAGTHPGQPQSGLYPGDLGGYSGGAGGQGGWISVGATEAGWPGGTHVTYNGATGTAAVRGGGNGGAGGLVDEFGFSAGTAYAGSNGVFPGGGGGGGGLGAGSTTKNGGNGAHGAVWIVSM